MRFTKSLLAQLQGPEFAADVSDVSPAIAAKLITDQSQPEPPRQEPSPTEQSHTAESLRGQTNVETSKPTPVALPASPPPAAKPPGSPETLGAAGVTGVDATLLESPSNDPLSTLAAPGMDAYATMQELPGGDPSSTLAGAGVENRQGTREQSDTLRFGPETRLVIQDRLVSNLDQIARAGGSPQRPDYELVEVIGRGGMGLVYAARQTSVDREVAVKMISPDRAHDESTRDDFLSEAVITGELDHPNIVPIHDVGKGHGNALFYSMKRVTGTPWQKVVATLPQTENLRILMAVADAVAFAHSRGVVHRDLKPENVMLGQFGEVLVMDWGLAIVTPEFRRGDSVSKKVGAGCTPSYAAPELVTGPLSIIGPQADVYLLGAILYQIVTGKPPHLANTPQECLRVAARNKINPTKETGELVDIALKAMATQPSDRYAGVKEFQNAIRSFQSHSESLLLTARATEELAEARRTGDYQDFGRAVFGYRQAFELWDENHAAKAGLSQARLAYAESALSKQDFDLGLTLLDPNDAEHAPLAARLLAGQNERNNRRRRLKAMSRTAIGLVAIIFIGGSAGSYQIYLAKERAGREKVIADEMRVEAEGSENAARAAQQTAEIEKNSAIAAKKEADTAKEQAVKSEIQATHERDVAKQATALEEQARIRAVRARQAQEFEAYVAQIGLASEQISANAFDSALTVLTSQKTSPHRGWEWYRLDYLARQGQTASLNVQSEVECIALDSAGSRFAAGLRDGRVLIGRVADLDQPAENAAGKTLMIEHGAAVLAVAFSPDDRFVISAGESGTLALWNAGDGTRVGPKFTGHDPTKSIHRARLINAGGRRWLLTASADRTAQLWDLSKSPAEWNSAPLQVLRGHHLQVWDAAMSPDGRRIVTAGDDGRAVVWAFSDEEGHFVPARTALDSLGTSRPRVFTGHDGGVYAAAFSPDGKLVTTAGLDKRVLIWNPERVVEDDLKQRMTAVADPLRIKQALSESIVLEGHTEPVHSLSFSRDGKYVLSGSDDNTIRIWPRTGDLQDVTVLRGHGGWVRSCLFSPQPNENGDWTVFSGSHDRQIKQWNVAGYAEVRALRVDRLADHGDAVLAAAFNPKGDKIVTASRDHVARVWQLSPGKFVPAVVKDAPLKLFEGHDFSATVARYLKDGRRVVTSGIDGQVCLWNVDSGAQLARLPGTGLTAALAVSPDDVWILTGSSDRNVKLWNLDEAVADYAAGRESKPVHQFEGHTAQVRVLAVSPDGSGRFYSGDEAGSGMLWNLNDRRQPPRELAHHTLRINAAVYLPDSSQFATAADDGLVYVCDATSGAIRSTLDHRSHSESIVALGVTPDGRRAITVGEPPSENAPFVIFDWSIEAGRLTRFAPLERGMTVFGMALAPNGQSPGALLALGRRSDGRTELRGWNLDTWKEQRASDDRQMLDDSVLSREHASVWSAAWSPDGAHVLTVGGNEAQVWQLNGRQIRSRLGPHRAVATAGFSSDGQFVITGSWDESFKIWTVANGSPRSLCRVSVDRAGAINSAAFTPVGGSFQILSAHDDGTARLWNWDSQTPEILPKPLGVMTHGKPVNAAAFSQDGSRLLTLCADGVARVWAAPPALPAPAVPNEDDKARQPLLELAGRHSGPLLCGAFSNDGKWIATAGEDKRIVLWNARTGQAALDAPLEGHSAAITSLAFSEDGKRLVTGSRDNTAKLWDLQMTQSSSETSAVPANGLPTATSVVDQKPQPVPAVAPEPNLRGKELLTLRGHSAEITSVAFSPDGRFVLTASLDSSAILWLTNKP
jgi:WD40 repeat protein